MHNSIKPIDVVIGEANDGHAELTEASLRECGIVNNLYRGRDDEEMLALVHGVWSRRKNVTDGPPLVLVDCGLPRVGGVGAVRAIKCDRRYGWMPIILMTNMYNRHQAEQCRRLRCEAYLTKWTVFLGLPGFVSRIRFLADRATWIASRRLRDGRSHGCVAGTLELRSMPDMREMHRRRLVHSGKEGTGGTSTP